MITLWNPDMFVSLHSFEGDGFVGIKVLWNGLSIYFVNFYSPYDLQNNWRLC